MKITIANILLTKRKKIARIFGILMFCLMLVLPQLLTKTYYTRVLTFCMVYACVASAWNVIAGYAGVFSWVRMFQHFSALNWVGHHGLPCGLARL